MNKLTRVLISVLLVFCSVCAITYGYSQYRAVNETLQTDMDITGRTIAVTLLFESPGDIRWFREIEVPFGTNAFEVTQMVVGNEIDAQYSEVFGSHFVKSIWGVSNQGDNYWLTYLLNHEMLHWEPLSVGSDLFDVKDGQVIAWFYADTGQVGEQYPSVFP